LVRWQKISQGFIVGDLVYIVDAAAASQPARFYQAEPVP
jgi:hypothetical protein